MHALSSFAFSQATNCIFVLLFAFCLVGTLQNQCCIISVLLHLYYLYNLIANSIIALYPQLFTITYKKHFTLFKKHFFFFSAASPKCKNHTVRSGIDPIMTQARGQAQTNWDKACLIKKTDEGSKNVRKYSKRLPLP